LRPLGRSEFYFEGHLIENCDNENPDTIHFFLSENGENTVKKVSTNLLFLLSPVQRIKHRKQDNIKT